MPNEICNAHDIIDSRDIESRIDELESERGEIVDAFEDAQESLQGVPNEASDDERGACLFAMDGARKALEVWNASDEASELRLLKAFRDELEPYCDDWQDGVTLIRDSYFTEYAQDLAEDIGGEALRDAHWPMSCIDWDKAASVLQQDYTSGEYAGVTYWAR